MIRKITTLLLAAMMVFTFGLPAANAAGNTDCNIVPSELNNIDIENIITKSNCSTSNASQLKETLQNRLNELNNCTPDQFLNILKEKCGLQTEITIDELTPEMLEDIKAAAPCTDAQPVSTSTSETAEIPPEETKAPVTAPAETDDMSLSLPTVDTKPEAQPIPTEAPAEVEPIPTTDEDAEVTPVTSIPPKAETPEATPQPTVEPAAEPTPVPTAEPTAAPTAAPTPTAVPVANTSGISDIERQMVDMVNEDRAAAGLSPLTIDVDLTYYAREHSADMSTNNFFSHTSPYNGSFSERLNDADLGVMGAGENIAMYGSVAKAQAALMASDGHRANILGNFTHIGIGIVYNESKSAYYITQWFARK